MGFCITNAGLRHHGWSLHEPAAPTSALADRSGPEGIHRHWTNIIYSTYFPNMVMEMEISTILRHYGSSMHELTNTAVVLILQRISIAQIWPYFSNKTNKQRRSQQYWDIIVVIIIDARTQITNIWMINHDLCLIAPYHRNILHLHLKPDLFSYLVQQLVVNFHVLPRIVAHWTFNIAWFAQFSLI